MFNPIDHRGLTILNGLGSVVTKIMNWKLVKWFESGGLIATEQIGFKPKYTVSTAHAWQSPKWCKAGLWNSLKPKKRITLTPYMVLPLFATRFADYAGGIRVSFIQPRLF